MTRFNSVIWRMRWKVLIFALVVLAVVQARYKYKGKQSRSRARAKANPCPNGPLKLPVLSKSQMCRCLHRPDFQDPTTTEFTDPPNNPYLLQRLLINDVDFGPNDFPDTANAVCVYFGHAVAPVPPGHETPEFVLQAINEHGWPTGTWSVIEFKAVCPAPTNLLRTRITDIELYDIRKCFGDDHDWGQEEGFHTEGNKNDHPFLLHFHNNMYDSYGMTALLHLNVQIPELRPTQLKFVVEAAYIESGQPQQVKMVRIESPTYSVAYNENAKTITLTEITIPSDGVSLNLDFAYQVRTKKIKPPDDWCLEPPQPPPPIPYYSENTCACFLRPRQVTEEILSGAGGNTVTAFHDRLNLSSSIPPFEDNPDVHDHLKDFYNTYKDMHIYVLENPTTEVEKHIVVLIYHFLPVYKERRFREREVAIGAFDHTGYPAGRFLDPFLDVEDLLYNKACDEAVKNLSSLGIQSWTRAPMQAVGECNPHEKNIAPDKWPCYFHFSFDYFYVDCVENCKEPKYICAVWQATDITNPPKAYEFQFITNSVYYENKDASNGSFVLPPDQSPCQPVSSGAAIKDWNLLETHLYNTPYHKRSDVWMYLPYRKDKKFLYVSKSDINSFVILNETYVNATINQTKYCVPPVTFFTEPKDNNLCLCTFWGESIDTWQTHYGRTTSCTHKQNTQDFREHFKIDFHSRQQDNVKVRVYANVDPNTNGDPNLLNNYFVLHAVYMMGMDQYGLPVGSFRSGHWVDQSNAADVRCPNNQFPPQSNPVNQQYPIFNVRSCPKYDYTDPGNLLSKYIKQNPTGSPQVYVYTNRWKDKFGIVCALFQFNPNEYPHTKHVQIIAFIRIEDINGGGHAYMLELRTPFLDAKDLSKDSPKAFADLQGTPTSEDRNVSYPPLNYGYYSKTLEVTPVHWARSRWCLDPVKEPERKFDLCRHYITTPIIRTIDKTDLDTEIDKYNSLCIQYITAYQQFGPIHSYTILLGNRLNNRELARNEAIADKNCFTLQAFKTRRKNAWHVRFRVKDTNVPALCDTYNTPYLKEAALVAYNEEGFPVGRPGGKSEFGGSFELYNHFQTAEQKRHEHCVDDDIKLTLDDVIENAKMAFHSEKGKCMYFENADIAAYRINTSSFHQDFVAPFDKVIPSMMIWANFKKLYNGFCAIWFFPKIRNATVVAPKTIQFVMQIQIVQKGVSPSVNNAANRLITIRSPKYEFKYDDTADQFETNQKPDLFKDATDPVNLDATVVDNCHDEELPIVNDKRPDDNCVCELRLATAPPVPNQKPLCTLRYLYYNNIFDNRLYRICLSTERRRDSDATFRDGECRTKLEYPTPPEIFPNEQITLEGVDENEFNSTIDLEPFDPTDEVYTGCGLIKRCISRFADVNVEKDCLRDKSCGLIASFGKGLGESHRTHDEITIEIYAVARGWAAIGISPNDEEMGEDYVMECIKEGGEVKMYNSWNYKSLQPGRMPYDNYRMRGDMGLHSVRNPIIRPVKTVFYEDKLYCKFYIKKQFSRIDPDVQEIHEYDLDNQYYYIMAFSHASTDPYGEEEGNLRSHILNGGFSAKGKGRIVAGERFSPLPHEVRAFRLHALFMVFAWIFFLTLSIFVARYFKETFIHVQIFKLDFWYFAHIVTGALSLVCLLIGVLFHLTAASGWRSQFRSNFHTYSGIVAFCLFVADFVVGVLLKRHIYGTRPLINWVHIGLGHFSYTLAVFNITFSDRVAYGFLSCNFETYLFLWMTVYFVLHAVMSYHYCWVNYTFAKRAIRQRFSTFNIITPMKKISLEISGAEKNRFLLKKMKKLEDLEAQRRASSKQEDEIVEAPGKYLRMTALAAFSVITCVYTFWIVRKIVTYPRFCYDFYQLKELESNGFN